MEHTHEGMNSSGSREFPIIADEYRLLQVIGQGGMGMVYLAQNIKTPGHRCALKLLKYEATISETDLKRFENECTILLDLKHENIVAVEKIGAINDKEFFIAMEFIDGGCLSDTAFGSSKYTFARLLKQIHEICLGLDYSHTKGVIHRDLKPDNVLLTSSGLCKISDFGLAKSEDMAQSLTKTGETVGTPYYMAPEQFRGEACSVSNDIYALGIIAFELFTGQRPFQHENYVALATMHLNHPLPKVLKYRNEAPKWFQEFVEACTDKNPKYRFQSMREIGEYIEQQLDEIGVELEHRFNKSTFEGTGSGAIAGLIKRLWNR